MRPRRPPTAISSHWTCVPRTGGGPSGPQTQIQTGLARLLAPLDMPPSHTLRWEPAGPPNTRPRRPPTATGSHCGTAECKAEGTPTPRAQIKLCACHRLHTPAPNTPAIDAALILRLSYLTDRTGGRRVPAAEAFCRGITRVPYKIQAAGRGRVGSERRAIRPEWSLARTASSRSGRGCGAGRSFVARCKAKPESKGQ